MSSSVYTQMALSPDGLTYIVVGRAVPLVQALPFRLGRSDLSAFVLRTSPPLLSLPGRADDDVVVGIASPRVLPSPPAPASSLSPSSPGGLRQLGQPCVYVSSFILLFYAYKLFHIPATANIWSPIAHWCKGFPAVHH